MDLTPKPARVRYPKVKKMPDIPLVFITTLGRLHSTVQQIENLEKIKCYFVFLKSLIFCNAFFLPDNPVPARTQFENVYYVEANYPPVTSTHCKYVFALLVYFFWPTGICNSLNPKLYCPASSSTVYTRPLRGWSTPTGSASWTSGKYINF